MGLFFFSTAYGDIVPGHTMCGLTSKLSLSNMSLPEVDTLFKAAEAVFEALYFKGEPEAKLSHSHWFGR